jgi:hypothetical protein
MLFTVSTKCLAGMMPPYAGQEMQSDTMFKDRSCSVRGCRGPYKGDAFDFLAAYLIPEDLWYIIPAAKFRMQGSIALYPNLKKSKYNAYLEAWQLLRAEPAVVARIEACAVTPFDAALSAC